MEEKEGRRGALILKHPVFDFSMQCVDIVTNKTGILYMNIKVEIQPIQDCVTLFKLFKTRKRVEICLRIYFKNV